jgi:hypothetical protein
MLGLITLLIVGCSRSHSPGEVETIGKGRVYHLADGILVQERRDGATHYYLIESTKADYEITEEGLKIEMKLEGVGWTRVIMHRAPQGYVAAWFSDFHGDGPEATRFGFDDTTFSKFLQKFTPAITVQDIYNLKL